MNFADRHGVPSAVVRRFVVVLVLLGAGLAPMAAEAQGPPPTGPEWPCDPLDRPDGNGGCVPVECPDGTVSEPYDSTCYCDTDAFSVVQWWGVDDGALRVERDVADCPALYVPPEPDEEDEEVLGAEIAVPAGPAQPAGVSPAFTG